MIKNIEISVGKMDSKITNILSSHTILRALTKAIIVPWISKYYEILFVFSIIILYFDFELVLIKMGQLCTVMYEWLVHTGGAISGSN